MFAYVPMVVCCGWLICVVWRRLCWLLFLGGVVSGCFVDLLVCVIDCFGL